MECKEGQGRPCQRFGNADKAYESTDTYLDWSTDIIRHVVKTIFCCTLTFGDVVSYVAISSKIKNTSLKILW